jgi:pyruvate-formate lyase-activating enzyme
MQLSSGWQGNAHLCACPAWQPFPVGNILTAESADAVWNSEAAREMRRSILDGDFSYCSRTLCSYISAHKLPRKAEVTDPMLRGYIDDRATVLKERPRMVDLNYDTTCNLACPSCRTEIRAATSTEQAAFEAARERVILPLLRETNGQVYVSGGGEVFSSRHGRSLLSALNRREYPGVSLFLISNAQLLTPRRWSDFADLPEMIGTLAVSIDAASAETYEKLRWPGKWSRLMTNLEHIAELRRVGTLRSFWINFVVQQANYREMLAFVDLADQLGADRVWFQRVTNYGAYDEATFAEVDVTSPGHPEHAELLRILRDPRLRGPRINRYMLLPLVPEQIADEQFEFLNGLVPIN